MPSTISEEIECNVFVRCVMFTKDVEEIKKNLGCDDDVESCALLGKCRERKDRFR